MFVKELMTTEVVTADVKTSIAKIDEMMKGHHIRRLPILKKGKLVGIITDLDLMRVSPSESTTLDKYELGYVLSKLKAKHIMRKSPATIDSNENVEKALAIMLEHHISGLSVVNEKDELVGIISKRDLFEVLIRIMSVKQGSPKFVLNM